MTREFIDIIPGAPGALNENQDAGISAQLRVKP